MIQIWCNWERLLNHAIDLVTKTPPIFKGKILQRLNNLNCGNIILLQNPDTMSAFQWSYLSYSCLLTELRPLAFASPERSFDWILSNFSRYLLTSFVSFRISSYGGLSLCYFPCCKLLIWIRANYHYLPTDKVFNVQPGIPTHAIKHVDVYEFLFHSNIFACPFPPLLIIMPVPHRIVLAPIHYPFSVRQFFIEIFYVGDYCSLGTVHSNSSLSAKILHWCLLFPWYWPFKSKHAHPRLFFYAVVYCCSVGTDDSNSSMLTRVSSVPLVW